jgi:hypothetical protein
MSRDNIHSIEDAAALRTGAVARALEARRLIQAAKESLDNVAKATNVKLITPDSDPGKTSD